MLISVFGASGKVGGTAAEDLRRRGHRVRAVVRNRARAEPLARIGCEIVEADLYDAKAVAHALHGADGALLICPLRPTADDVLADAARVVEASAEGIEKARPGQVVVISDYGAHVPARTGVTLVFHAMEERLRALTPPLTFLRSAEHMQNWGRQVRVARARGVLSSLHHPVTKMFPTVSAFDVGTVAASLLEVPADHRGVRVLHVEGPRRVSAVDVARVFSQGLGKEVVAEALAREDWAKVLTSAGLGADYARLVEELQDTHNAGGIDVEPGGEVIRGATELSDALMRLLSAT